MTIPDPKTDERRAVEAAVSIARSLGLRADEPAVLASMYSVRVHLKPSPIVARVPTWTAILRPDIGAWLAREIAVTRFLEAQGAPVIPPATIVDPGPHEQNGFAVSLWEYVPPEPNGTVSHETFLSMVAELHGALRAYPDELPLLGPPANDIPAALRIIEEERVLEGEKIDVLRAAYDRLKPAIDAPAGELQPLHGDAHPGNLVATRRGVLWNDFEDVCRGPIAWDLATLLLAPEAVRGYPNGPPPETLELYRDVRRLQVACWLVALPFEFEGRAGFVESLFAHLAR